MSVICLVRAGRVCLLSISVICLVRAGRICVLSISVISLVRTGRVCVRGIGRVDTGRWLVGVPETVDCSGTTVAMSKLVGPSLVKVVLNSNALLTGFEPSGFGWGSFVPLELEPPPDMVDICRYGLWVLGVLSRISMGRLV